MVVAAMAVSMTMISALDQPLFGPSLGIPSSSYALATI